MNIMKSLVSLLLFRPTAAELLKHKFFTKAKVSFTSLLQKINLNLFIYLGISEILFIDPVRNVCLSITEQRVFAGEAPI